MICVPTIQLGTSGPRVPPVCVGTYTLAGAWSGDLRDATKALRHGVDNGLGFFDTAHAYGRAESILGEVFKEELAHERERIVLCSKGGLELRRREGAATPFVANSRPEFLRSSLEKSLDRIGVDYLDVFLVHWFDPEVPIPEVADALRGFVEEGLVRHVGVSNYSVEQMTTFLKTGRIDVIQVPYSLFSRGVEAEVLPFAREHGIGVMGYAALAQGFLTGTFAAEPDFAEKDFRRGAPDFSGERYSLRVAAVQELREVALAKGCTVPDLAVSWVMAAGKAPVVPLVGVQAPGHVDDLLRAVDVEFSEAEMDRIRAIVDGVPEMDFASLVS